MNRRSVVPWALAFGAVVCASGERAARAQAASPTILALTSPTRATFRAPLANGNIYDSVQIGYAGADNRWIVSIAATGPHASNAAPQITLVCLLKVASVEDADTLAARILNPRTHGIGCAGTWTQDNSGGRNNYRMIIDLTTQSNSTTGLTFDVD